MLLEKIGSLHQKIFMPTFSIGQLRAKEWIDPAGKVNKIYDFGTGTWKSYKKTVDFSVKTGIKAHCILPITETDPGDASNFGRTSSNALSYRNFDLDEIEEIKNSKKLMGDLEAKFGRACKVTGGKGQIGIVEVVYPEMLEKAFDVFKLSDLKARREAFKAFCEEQSWWLDKYAYDKVIAEENSCKPMDKLEENYNDMESSEAKSFIKQNADRIDYFKYVQMECYRQAKDGFDYGHQQGIKEIELLIGVGVSRHSAEGFLMRTIFDLVRQIGCFPEPENGYPLQLWGFLAEIMGQELLKYKAQSFLNMQKLGVDRVGIDHACGFFGGYTTFPVFGRDGRVLNANDPKDAAEAEEGGRWEIPLPKVTEQDFAEFGRRVPSIMSNLRCKSHIVADKNDIIDPKMHKMTVDGFEMNPGLVNDSERRRIFDILQNKFFEQENKRFENGKKILAAIFELAPGMKLTAETVGDPYRRTAAEKAIIEAIENGADISLMLQLPWEKSINFDEHKQYHRVTLSHDMPPLTTLLTGMAGVERREWINGPWVQWFLNLLGILSPAMDRPINISELTPEFMSEIQKRISSGSNAGTVVIPLSSLFNLIPAHLDTGYWQFINIMPGTNSSVGNELGSWEGRLPHIEELENIDSEIRDIADPTYRPFGEVNNLYTVNANSNFAAQVAQVKKASVAYQAADGGWTVWNNPRKAEPIAEISIVYKGKHKAQDGGIEGKEWANYDLSFMGFKKDKTYFFEDLVGGECYAKTGEELISEGLSVGLNLNKNRHHFVVFKKS